MFEEDVGEFPGVAQAKIEALAGDRVQGLRAVTDPHLALLRDLRSRAQGQWKAGAWAAGDEVETLAELLA